MLALKSAIRAAELIIHADTENRSLRIWERILYTRQVTGWMNQYGRIIRAFYDRAGFEVFMNPSPFFQIPGSLGRLVGGDSEPRFLDVILLFAFHLICKVQRFVALAPSIPSLR